MTWYEILSLIGLPGLLLTLLGVVLKKLQNTVKENEATKQGVQALLRAQMISEYNKAKDKGYSAIYSKENFENLWKHYHSLGVNGVMDGIHESYMDLPNRKEDARNEHQLEDKA